MDINKGPKGLVGGARTLATSPRRAPRSCACRDGGGDGGVARGARVAATIGGRHTEGGSRDAPCLQRARRRWLRYARPGRDVRGAAARAPVRPERAECQVGGAQG